MLNICFYKTSHKMECINSSLLDPWRSNSYDNYNDRILLGIDIPKPMKFLKIVKLLNKMFLILM